MRIQLNEWQLYKNFDELANDILDMAKEFLPDRLIYLTSFTEQEQIILKLSETDTNIQLHEGMTVPLQETVCNRIDFASNAPLIFEDMRKEAKLDDLRLTLIQANINAYLGVPILLANGDPFGTLCAAHSEASEFSAKSIEMLQRIAKLFSYYLDLERMAFRDALTGLYNRQFLFRNYEAVSAAGALFFLDLDGFKQINDKLGHDTGDSVLREVAVRLEKFVQHHGGIAVRLGGDEFIVNMMDRTDVDEVRKLAEGLLDRLSTWDAQLEALRLSVSIGIVLYAANGDHKLDSLLKHADNALYRAKANGKNTYQF
ncbi:sensor domain-containing diguanylate cyclase [Paenibacillus aestuarii]|uniref:Sensor domain-containing diguanylate cyclase n=1 Tax=Paenibacillus aestuarii TaxID=516965 RepID=A0ABW0KH01_9BACL|nr:sensor domain-containing diguanylate cyclase [Paenibacillus aestuarii]